MDRTSELENVVLGIVWKRGPCTPHAIRKNFLTSRNNRWSGSTGAIYPLVKRMEERGLLRSKADTTTRQEKRVYAITASGRKLLLEWLTPPLPSTAFGVPDDPIRNRVYFLEPLSIQQRQAFFDDAERGLREQMENLRADGADYAVSKASFSVIANDGAIAVCRAQIRWIRRARRALCNGEGRQ